jgi:hypothetical protein
MRRFFFVAFLAAGCAPGDPLPPPPDGQGFQMAMDIDSPPASETWKCLITQIPTTDTHRIHRVQHVQTAAVHHMDITVLLYSGAQTMPPGLYDCAPLYQMFPKLMEEQTLYAAQSPEGDILLPDGIAAVVPPGITVMYELHHVNATTAPVHISSRVNAWDLPPDQPFGGTLGSFTLRARRLDIPPHSDKTEWAQCVMDQDVDMIFMSSHTHKLGRDVHILKYGGADAGTELFVNTDWQLPKLQNFSPPLHFAAGEGIELRCHYENDGDTTVNWGFLSTDEMCNGVLVFTPGSGARCNEVANSAGMPDDTTRMD